jgi:hypothetical protein
MAESTDETRGALADAVGLNADDLRRMQDAIDFVAASWWRRWIIRLVSNGKVRFEGKA